MPSKNPVLPAPVEDFGHPGQPRDKQHLARILSDYVRYYNRSRTHLALKKDPPEPRAVHDRGL
ncbi:MAG: hypothetical protein JRH16_20830 [Deltaproteobacteria bacterium]|nr:hypothetical protein [Deltaproteobacteria bacterium]